MKQIKNILVLILWFNLLIQAQTPVDITGEQTIGVRNLNMDVNSSKFNQYRDINNGVFIPNLKLNFDQKNDWFLNISGSNLLQLDQSLNIHFGDYYNNWNLYIFNNKTPHRFSNRAQTPFLQNNGVLTVPQTVGIIRDGDTTTGTPSLEPTRGQMSVNDSLIAAYVKAYSRPTTLAVERELLGATLNLPNLGPVSVNLTYTDERRTGNRITYGTIGDRPPRTLNAQMQEPVNYITREVHADAEYITDLFQAQVSYIFSMFNNRIDNMTWQNMFFRPHSASDYIASVAGTARNVSLFGQRNLAPDNLYNNISLTWGLNLPFESRLTSSFAIGFMNQDQDLLPYSFSTLGGDTSQYGDGKAWNDLSKLPRQKAQASMRTIRFNAEYSINLIGSLNLRPFINYYNLKNETPTSQWRYVTQDVAGTNGDVSYVNYRQNLAYAFSKLGFGANVGYYLNFWRTSLNLTYTHEKIDRDYREANTSENILNARLRFRPINSLTLSASYLWGNRTGDGYDYKVTSNSYWYTFARGANQVDNPQFLFANHPDLRKFDVSDRLRNNLNISAALQLNENLDLALNFGNRSNDYSSGVVPVAPLLGAGIPFPNPADEFATTPGQQLGLLKDNTLNIGGSLNYTYSSRFNINLFGDIENTVSDVRGHVFNENQRRQPSIASIQAPTALGPWTDPARIYNSETTQKTNTLGLGLNYELIPGKLRFYSDFSLSLTEMDMVYSGYGSDATYLGRSWETFDFGFDDPKTIKYDQFIINASFEYSLFERMTLGFHYLFSHYKIQDWVDGAIGPWVEQVGTENFVRDTSRDNRWGNRLVNMGLYLAPSYAAHLGFITVKYQF
jgi:hypothetical protein